MSLNHYIQPKKKVPLKAALRRMRGLWLKGEVSRFDEKLARILKCSLERAEEIREEWLEMGFLGFDRRGLLTWKNRGF